MDRADFARFIVNGLGDLKISNKNTTWSLLINYDKSALKRPDNFDLENPSSVSSEDGVTIVDK